MKEKVRVRFAPSPTGYLHVGGLRTALFNWLFARGREGVFILRIEDTDRDRSTEEAIKAIEESLCWLGLNWDEGPYRQTEHLSLYQKIARELLEKNQAYRCFCQPEELEARRKKALAEGKPPQYDGRCRRLSRDEQEKLEEKGLKSSIRFVCPDKGTTEIGDLIKGKVAFENVALSDFIILRSNGFPTYNFAVVVDDHDMDITHVIRGEDHLSNTPKQVLLYQALGWRAPQFAHMSLTLGPDGARLSKRHGATSVGAYRKEGYLPEAMINYSALLGWSLDEKTTLISRSELVKHFSLERVSKNPSVFDLEKLKWMNGHYIREKSVPELTKLVVPYLKEAGFDISSRSRDWLEKMVSLVQERINILKEVVPMTKFLFEESVEIDPKAVAKVLSKETALLVLKSAEEKLSDLDGFVSSEIESVLRTIPEELSVKARDAFQPIRVAVAGSIVSPPLFESLELLGKEKTLERIRMTRNMLKKGL